MVIESVPLLEILVKQGVIYKTEVGNGTIVFTNDDDKTKELKHTQEIIDAAVNELTQIKKNNE